MKIKEIKTFIKSFFTRKYCHYVKIYDIWCGTSTQFNEHILKRLLDYIQFQELINAQMVGNPQIMKIENERMYIMVWYKKPY